MDLPKRRGRKPRNVDPEDILHDNRTIGFVPSRVTREQLVYCMRESGIHSKSAILSMAIKNYHDMLLAEARRRVEAENYEIAQPIGPNTFLPSKE